MSGAPVSTRALMYGARDETFWSGTPYYFSAELKRFGGEEREFVVEDLPPRRGREVVFPFLAWAARMRCRRTALFLLSQQYHDASVPSFERQGTAGLVSFSQVLPDAVLRHKRATPDFKLVQYVDVTLTQLLADFDYAQDTPERVRDSLLEVERRAYAASDKVVVFHAGTRDALQDTYGLHPDRVRVLGRGVNLPPEAMASAGSAAARQQGPVLRLMVVGRGPRRKGVFRLIEAIDALHDWERARIELHLAGPSPDELPARAYLRPMGFVGRIGAKSWWNGCAGCLWAFCCPTPKDIRARCGSFCTSGCRYGCRTCHSSKPNCADSLPYWSLSHCARRTLRSACARSCVTRRCSLA